MKRSISIFFLLVLITLFGCQKDEDAIILKKEITNSELNGMWTLSNVSGGFAGVSLDFPVGWITWQFDDSNNTLTVINNNQYGNPIYDGLQTGTYNYDSVLTFTSCGDGFNTLDITNAFESCYVITDNVLTIENSQIADGYVLKFNRMLICGTN